MFRETKLVSVQKRDRSSDVPCLFSHRPIYQPKVVLITLIPSDDDIEDDSNTITALARQSRYDKFEIECKFWDDTDLAHLGIKSGKKQFQPAFQSKGKELQENKSQHLFGIVFLANWLTNRSNKKSSWNSRRWCANLWKTPSKTSPASPKPSVDPKKAVNFPASLSDSYSADQLSERITDNEETFGLTPHCSFYFLTSFPRWHLKWKRNRIN